MLRQIDLNPVLDTSAYSNGDSLFPLMEVYLGSKINRTGNFIVSLTIVDISDQSAELEFFLFGESVNLATVNDPFSLSASDSKKCQGRIAVELKDWFQVGSGIDMATKSQINLGFVPGGKSIFIAGKVSGSHTYAADGLSMKMSMVSYA